MAKILWEYIQLAWNRILAIQRLTYNPHYTLVIYDYAELTEKIMIGDIPPKAGQS